MTGQSVDVGAADRVESLIDDPARRPLIALSTFAFIAVVTGTFMYCYPNTMEALQTAMVWIHDVSGDLTLLAGAWYLTIHLKRVWRMWRRVLQRWSGYVAVGIFALAGGTGIYGQLYPMPDDSPAGIMHIISSIAAVVLGCFHGGYGLRRKTSLRRD
jgi:hypothetical protein